MANNKMYLIHKPSKVGVMLGKRMDFGWGHAPDIDLITSFYEKIAQDGVGHKDDFVLAMEDPLNENQFGEWNYDYTNNLTGLTKDGFVMFEITGDGENDG